MSFTSDLIIAAIFLLIVVVIIFRKKIWLALIEIGMDFLIMLALFVVSQFLVYAMHLSLLSIVPAILITFALWRFNLIKPKDGVVLGLFYTLLIVSFIAGPVTIWMLIAFIGGMVMLAIVNILGWNSEMNEALDEISK